ncbi:lactonase family protein [Plectonema radiosum NIES-515]|uniref:Lactonase family protein n=1 Tax=Plectonema radiosum NIES-515 TaxID=2986073 RepID=A0ABT3AUL3_9CYAN|nr:lactonase family protein [Plectonema radiosum]MCV3212415.1 lactonase family protein [Plectonema radiosum NIES-515]
MQLVNPFSDTVKIINVLPPEEVIASDGVADLSPASISVGDFSKQYRPRHVATTPNASVAHVPSMETGEIAVVDLRGLRPLDINPNEDGIQSIKLKNAAGTAPADIVIHPNQKYAYVADRNKGQIFVLSINPYSRSFNQHVSTIQLSDAPNGICQMAMNSDGTRLFVTSATSNKAGAKGFGVLTIDNERLSV